MSLLWRRRPRCDLQSAVADDRFHGRLRTLCGYSCDSANGVPRSLSTHSARIGRRSRISD